MTDIYWKFAETEVSINLLSDNVGYSWTCGLKHAHTIECLWIWHNCTMELDPVRRDYEGGCYIGWSPAGVLAHDFISVEPLHIEPSIYWPECCGMHGWIRDGHYISV